ncbi:MAG: lytic murein transglycosylase [Alphaproteobacteria bacterium]|jgi:membrane-bound lytic murein transglycosylase B|nr:lytic murein transglycosylase [Alphaproteobacteria bacterium]
MLKIHRWFILLGLLFIVFIALAVDFGEKRESDSFKRWKDSFVQELQQSGISDNTIKKFQDNAMFSQSVVDSYNTRVNNSTYTVSVDEDTLLTAQIFYRDNKPWLEEEKEKNNVLPEVVVAMFAINSAFGEKMGDNSAINVLASLSFNPKSTDEYKPELLAFLMLVDRGYFDVNVMANNDGTMSYIGIRPTLYMLYGVDGNKDGIVDLFATKEDIVATSFSLLKNLGLSMDSWGNEVSLPNTMDFQSRQGVRNLMTLDKWKDMGVASANDIPLPRDSRSSFLIILDGYARGVLLYNNFNVIFKTNGNVQRSLDILALSDKISEYRNVLTYSEQNVKPVAKKPANESEASSKKKKPKKDDLPVPTKYKELEAIK